MSDLSVFFAQNANTDVTEDFVVSERFKDKDGNPVPWKLRGLTEEENEQCRKQATRKVKGRNGIQIPETDTEEYLAKLVVASVVFPNLKDEKLQDSYGVRGAENVVRKMLLAGEYAGLVQKVQEINGFDKSMNDLVDEVKN